MRVGTLESVVDLLAHRHPGTVEVLIGPVDRRVGEVRRVEQVDQVDDAPAGALLVLERGSPP